MNKINTTKKLTILSLFVAIGLLLQYIEGRFSIVPIPGGKLGLCNVVSIINIFLFGGGNALVVAFLRSLMGAMLFGGAMTIPYSVVGAVLSTLAMCVLKPLYPKISCIGISIVGAVIHNLSQLCVAFTVYGTVYVFSYMPILLITALFSGFVTGYVTHIFINRLLKKEQYL